MNQFDDVIGMDHPRFMASAQAGIDALGSTKGSVSQYENDYYQPSLEMLNAFCDLTRVDLGWLARGEEVDGAESTQPSPDLPGLTGFGERWKQARVTAGLSQEQVAHALNVSRVSVSHYESGRNEPGLEALIRFCAITRTSVEWLVLGTESSIPRQGDLPKALETYLRQTAALVDAVRPLVSDAFVQPPAVENYVQFAQYLVTLSKK